MNIVVAVRCLNEAHNIERFMRGYDFADSIVVSDGGSTDGSVEMLSLYPKVKLIHFTGGEWIDDHFWNTDAPHMNFVLDAAKELDPTWLIFDDMDCIPNAHLRINARTVLEQSPKPQVNAFRLYLWGEDRFFPQMNQEFKAGFQSLWAWKPNEVYIHADTAIRHGTIRGVIPDPHQLDVPLCLLHKSWSPETIQAKIDRYNAIGLPMNHPLDFAGPIQNLPEWAKE